jgi:arylamine N-acetyltransferase
MVRDGCGGYCFEQNLLLGFALTALGFQAIVLAARVLRSAPEDAVTARGHVLLLIDLDGVPYLVDAGFGGLTLTCGRIGSPLRPPQQRTHGASPGWAQRAAPPDKRGGIQEVLEEAFRLTLPDAPGREAALTRLIAQAV